MSSLGKLSVMLLLGKQTLFFSRRLSDFLIIVNCRMQTHHYHHHLKQVKTTVFEE